MEEKNLLLRLIKEKEKITIVTHILPDGDSIGSSLAFGLGLEKLGKKVVLFCHDPVPRKYRFMEHTMRFQKIMDLEKDTLIIALDCSNLDRIGPLKENLKEYQLINIDHHVTNEYFADLNLVDTRASATGEIIYNLLVELNVPLDYNIATALYVAITTDTGSFKYENTSADTFRIAAELMKYGLDPYKVAMEVFENCTLASVYLLRRSLYTLELFAQQRIASITVTEQMLRECGSIVEDLEGMVNYVKNIEGVEAGVLFYCKDDEEIKIGFRSKNIDISKVAKKFGGGGHPKAAGCRVNGKCEEIKEQVVEAIEKVLPAAGDEK